MSSPGVLICRLVSALFRAALYTERRHARLTDCASREAMIAFIACGRLGVALTYTSAVLIGCGLVFFGVGILIVMAVIFRGRKWKQDFGVETDLPRAATLCVYAGLIILGMLALGLTVEAVGRGLRQGHVISCEK